MPKSKGRVDAVGIRNGLDTTEMCIREARRPVTESREKTPKKKKRKKKERQQISLVKLHSFCLQVKVKGPV